jgi:hypothetical protein
VQIPGSPGMATVVAWRPGHVGSLPQYQTLTLAQGLLVAMRMNYNSGQRIDCTR